MAAKRKKKPQKRRSSNEIQVRRAADGKSYELLPPSSVRERKEDMEEVHSMLAAGETEIAVDELRWLVGGCHELLEAHYLLGKIAVEEGNHDLARAHLGYAYQLGLDAIPKRGLGHPLPHANPANQAFFEAGAGLAKVLLEMGEANKGKEVALQLLRLDPTDPLGMKDVLGT